MYRINPGMGSDTACLTVQQLASCCDSCAQGGSCGRGLAGCGCGGTCSGMGIFESGFDLSQWGWAEWAVVAVGGYMLISTVSTTRRVGKSIADYPARRRSAKAARYRLKAMELTRKRR